MIIRPPTFETCPAKLPSAEKVAAGGRDECHFGESEDEWFPVFINKSESNLTSSFDVHDGLIVRSGQRLIELSKIGEPRFVIADVSVASTVDDPSTSSDGLGLADSLITGFLKLSHQGKLPVFLL